MTMILVEQIVLTGTQSSITFSNIPQDATDLLILTCIRGTDGAASANVEMTVNSSTSGYASRLLYGTGNSVAVATGATNRIQWASNVPAAGGTSNTFGNGEIYIPDYRSSVAKTFMIKSVAEANATGSRQDLNTASWSGTSAITTINIFMEQGSLASGSTATLYKIIKGSSGGITIT